MAGNQGKLSVGALPKGEQECFKGGTEYRKYPRRETEWSGEDVTNDGSTYSEPAPGIDDLGSRLGRQVAGGAKFEKTIFFQE